MKDKSKDRKRKKKSKSADQDRSGGDHRENLDTYDPSQHPSIEQESTQDDIHEEEIVTYDDGSQPVPQKPQPLGEDPSIESVTPQVGQELGHYKLVRKLGQGGFGQVWEAEDGATGRRVALKILARMLTSSEEQVERFKREGRLAASINHPHCVYIFSAEEVNGFPIITMELVPGGTLQDILDREKHLAPEVAVDYVLELIDGLEAALDKGIIHRDIKPSNCFIDDRGRLKIGDFGLSRSLEADYKLTVTGTFMGTPAFASPEQIRGRDVDYRSDIYSVGASLYALLTGKHPFEASHAGEMMARILSEEPRPLSDFPFKIPQDLQKVITRCLDKDQDKRYQSYNALRIDLLPHSSRGMATGSGKLFERVKAQIVDSILMFIIFTPLLALLIKREVWYLCLAALIVTLYTFVCEGAWGQGLGKWIFGLRVVTSSGTKITWRQSFFRSIVYNMYNYFPTLFYLIFDATEFWRMGISALYMLILFSSMRTRNSYAGLHELASGTRVMLVEERSTTLPKSVPTWIYRTLPEQDQELPRSEYGPFQTESVLNETPQERLLVAYDEALKRKVWVRDYHAPERTPPLQRSSPNRPTTLRWLQGKRDDSENWDAYEAPDGTNLIHYVRSRGPLTWTNTRSILLDLAREASSALDESKDTQEASLAHIWIESSGQVKLLEFPMVPLGSIHKESFPSFHLAQWDQLLQHVVHLCLTGTMCPDEFAALPAVPLPEFVKPILSDLYTEQHGSDSLSEFIQKLEDVGHRRSTITPMRRAASLAIAAAPALCLFSFVLMFVITSQLGRDYFDGMLTAIYLKRIERLEKKPELTDQEQELKSSYKMILVWTSNRDEPSSFVKLPNLSQSLEKMKDLPDISTLTLEQVQSARQVVDAAMPYRKIPIILLSFLYEVIAAGSILFAVIFRSGFSFSILAMTLQTQDGRKASRLRVLARFVITWSPILPIWLLDLTMGEIPVPIMILVGLVYVGGSVFALIHPEKGLPDRIVATQLVPR